VQYVQTLGISEQWQFVDVWGFEKELLEMVPQPVCAVLLLYPISHKVYMCFFEFIVLCRCRKMY
jgi:Ubiquitin carboxyl-terminal hydrolase, family 1